jgi:hypothetical protein
MQGQPIEGMQNSCTKEQDIFWTATVKKSQKLYDNSLVAGLLKKSHLRLQIVLLHRGRLESDAMLFCLQPFYEAFSNCPMRTLEGSDKALRIRDDLCPVMWRCWAAIVDPAIMNSLAHNFLCEGDSKLNTMGSNAVRGL